MPECNWRVTVPFSIDTVTNERTVKRAIRDFPGKTANWYNSHWGVKANPRGVYEAFNRATKKGVIRSEQVGTYTIYWADGGVMMANKCQYNITVKHNLPDSPFRVRECKRDVSDEGLDYCWQHQGKLDWIHGKGDDKPSPNNR